MKGFTLIETIVAIFIFTLLTGALFGFVVSAYKVHGYGWEQSLAIREAQRGIETMVKELREAQPSEQGSFPIEIAQDKEIIFYSDIDKDEQIERVRYFLGGTSSGVQTQECETFADGGSCSVDFSNFLQGDLTTAQLKVSVDGDFGWNNIEYASIYADGNHLGNICRTGCSDCAGTWQGTLTFDVTEWAIDGSILFLADSSSWVNNVCPEAMKVQWELSWSEESAGEDHQFKRGIINPVGDPPIYPEDEEEIQILSSYVRNAPPIFEYFYFDEETEEIRKIEEYPARLKDTQLVKVLLVVNVNTNKAPQDFELESFIQLRNLKGY